MDACQKFIQLLQPVYKQCDKFYVPKCSNNHYKSYDCIQQLKKYNNEMSSCLRIVDKNKLLEKEYIKKKDEAYAELLEPKNIEIFKKCYYL
jgi:hypothetical protein